jgi:uncharacterized membrane protein
MERMEKKLLDVVALSSMVIALSSTGTMVATMIDVYGGTILPSWLIRSILVLIALASFCFAAYALFHYVRKE